MQDIEDQSWNESDVLDLSPQIHPPRFMFSGDRTRRDTEEGESIIQRHYNWAVSVLEEENGYSKLITIKQRLDEHLSTATDKAKEYESRRNYLQLKIEGVKRKVDSIAKERAKDNSDEAITEERKQVAEEQTGTHWQKADGTFNPPADEGKWSLTAQDLSFLLPDREDVPEYNITEDKVPISNTYVEFTPEPEELKEFDKNHLETSDTSGWGGKKTWEEVVDLLSEQRDLLEEKFEKSLNTVGLVRCRRSAVESVLFRFETLGTVTTMSDSKANSYYLKQLPDIFSGRPSLLQHAEEIVKEYRNNPTSLPDNMSKFRAWIGTNGGSILAQLQRAIRQDNLSDHYNHGNPESFCELVDLLVRRHHVE